MENIIENELGKQTAGDYVSVRTLDPFNILVIDRNIRTAEQRNALEFTALDRNYNITTLYSGNYDDDLEGVLKHLAENIKDIKEKGKPINSSTLGYDLIVLGDIEKGWEEKLLKVNACLRCTVVFKYTGEPTPNNYISQINMYRKRIESRKS